jgi:hypothetical protein
MYIKQKDIFRAMNKSFVKKIMNVSINGLVFFKRLADILGIRLLPSYKMIYKAT